MYTYHIYVPSLVASVHLIPDMFSTCKPKPLNYNPQKLPMLFWGPYYAYSIIGPPNTLI